MSNLLASNPSVPEPLGLLSWSPGVLEINPNGSKSTLVRSLPSRLSTKSSTAACAAAFMSAWLALNSPVLKDITPPVSPTSTLTPWELIPVFTESNAISLPKEGPTSSCASAKLIVLGSSLSPSRSTGFSIVGELSSPPKASAEANALGAKLRAAYSIRANVPPILLAVSDKASSTLLPVNSL